jgi:hypothetical protein
MTKDKTPTMTKDKTPTTGSQQGISQPSPQPRVNSIYPEDDRCWEYCDAPPDACDSAACPRVQRMKAKGYSEWDIKKGRILQEDRCGMPEQGQFSSYELTDIHKAVTRFHDSYCTDKRKYNRGGL